MLSFKCVTTSMSRNRVTGADAINSMPGSSGNITADPLFAEPAGEYHISEDSPARGAGDPAAAPDEDIDGDPRPGLDNAVDIGADEVTDDVAPGVISITRLSPSPTNGNTAGIEIVFSEPVTGVDVSDLDLSTTGNLADVTINGMQGAGTTYAVEVLTGTGDGTIRLDVIDNDSIVDLNGNPLGGSGAGNGNFNDGEVFVVDKTAPEITLGGETIVTIERGSFYADAGATATDNLDGDITARIIPTGFVDIGTLGVYNITFVVFDTASNQSVPVTRVINVVDTIAPTLVLNGENPVTLEFGTPYNEAGAIAFDTTDGEPHRKSR